MNFSIHWRSIRLHAGTLLAIAGFGLIGPGAAQAGCHGRVVADSDTSRAFASLTSFAIDSITGVPTDRSQGSEEQRSPCFGLSCSETPTIPLAPSQDDRQVDHWACLFPDSGADPESFEPQTHSERVSPRDVASPLDRPPRLLVIVQANPHV